MSSSEKSRILIADPEIFNQATLIGTLKDHYHVAIAQNSDEIFKAVNKQTIDLILLDTRYPGESGVRDLLPAERRGVQPRDSGDLSDFRRISRCGREGLQCRSR